MELPRWLRLPAAVIDTVVGITITAAFFTALFNVTIALLPSTLSHLMLRFFLVSTVRSTARIIRLGKMTTRETLRTLTTFVVMLAYVVEQNLHLVRDASVRGLASPFGAPYLYMGVEISVFYTACFMLPEVRWFVIPLGLLCHFCEIWYSSCKM